MIRTCACIATLFLGCSSNGSDGTTAPAASTSSSSSSSSLPDTASSEGAPIDNDAVAHVTDVRATGQSGDLSFTVTIASPDTGCSQYANWWEVLDDNGTLLYRRILGHSHVDEQPFTRSGGPVDIGLEQTVFIRAHMHPSGYGGDVWRGSVDAGFERDAAPPSFDAGLETADPQPDGCAF